MKRAYFISDLHLGASYLGDTHDRERKIIDFLSNVERDMSELYLLGDILDYWYEYKYVVPRGYVRFFGKIAQLADKGVKIVWLTGNHDIWMFDYLKGELGIEVVDGVYETKVLGMTPMLMAHGDGIKIRSGKFKLLRGLFRNKICQMLYAGIHPRWTIPFAHGWSNHSRMEGSRGDYLGINSATRENVKLMKEYCNEIIEKRNSEHDIVPDYFLFGHLHEMVIEELDGGREMLVTGDWIKHDSYAVFDGKKIELKVWKG